MQTHHLRALLAIAETGSFTSGAKRLEISQSSLSHAIADFERELGVRLFDRNRQGAQPTEVGDQVLSHARQILAAMDSIKAVADGNSMLLTGRIRIGSIPSATVSVLPKIIAKFSRQYPNIEVVLLEEPSQGTQELAKWLRAGTIDVALLELPVNDLATVPLMHDELCAIVPETSKFAARDLISVRELAKEPFIWSRYSTEHLILAAYARHRLAPQVRFHVQDIGTLVNMVREGLGISIVPRLAFSVVPRGVAFVRISPRIQREVGFALKSIDQSPAAVRAFIRMAEALVPKEQAE